MILDQSTSAQAYLEILRIWTRNNTDDGHLLFRDVASAGVNIETVFTRKNVVKGVHLLSTDKIKHDNASLRALRHILPEHKPPLNASETDYILARAANRKLQGVFSSHMYWNYIVCFRTSVNDELQRLKKVLVNNNIYKPELIAAPKAEIVFLPGTYVPGDPSATAKAIMTSLEGWVHKTLRHKENKWAAPTKPMRGMWRTKQIVIPKEQYAALCANGNNSKWKAIAADTKCFLDASFERGDGTRLITITGQESHVGEAADQVAKFWL